MAPGSPEVDLMADPWGLERGCIGAWSLWSVAVTDESKPSGRPRTVMLHGFTQNGRCLGPLAEWLAGHGEVSTPDLPGHGVAAALGDLDCPGSADHLARTCGYGDWFGYSLGGRVALHVALRHPEVVRRLVVLGATPGIADEDARLERRRIDRERAGSVRELGVEEFCRQWLSMPMFAGLPQRAGFLRERSSNTVDGLASSLIHAGTGSMTPLWDRLDELEMPVLVLAGEHDPAYVEIAARMVGAIGTNATLHTITGAGHAAHLEAPEITTDVIEAFLTGPT